MDYVFEETDDALGILTAHGDEVVVALDKANLPTKEARNKARAGFGLILDALNDSEVL